MDPADVLAAAQEHALAEALGDMDRTLATLCPEPVFEFHPVGLTIRGWDPIERFYREQYGRFASRVVDAEVYGEWANDDTAIQEYRVEVRGDDDEVRPFRVLSMTPVLEDGKLAGERLYADEAFYRLLLGPLFDVAVPIEGAADAEVHP
ncbi:MAG: hypothetical protein AAGK32_10185 [Actinomycetota bacterium]